MLTALALAPGALLVSSSIGLIVATIVAVLVALTMMPALLMVLGTERQPLAVRRRARRQPVGRDRRARAARPGVAAFFVALPLLLLAAPAIAAETGPPNVANLPPNDPRARQLRGASRDRGAGWAAPFEVDFHTHGPITTTARLQALGRLPEARQRACRASQPCSGRPSC